MTKILLVEDNEMNRDMLSRRLVRKGFEIALAVDGLQGVAMANAGGWDLILMDISLPEIDGWEATQQGREAKVRPGTHVPRVALRARAPPGARRNHVAADRGGVRGGPPWCRALGLRQQCGRPDGGGGPRGGRVRR